MQTNTFGAEWQYNATDYKLNPRRGISIQINANVGQRTIQKNNIIQNLYEVELQACVSFLE